MDLSSWLLAALLSLPPPSRAEEALADRHVRLRGVTAALSASLDLAVMTGALPGRERRLWAAAAIATLVHESGRLARAVHSGERLGDDGRSICLMQINRGNPGAYLPLPHRRGPMYGVAENPARKMQRPVDFWRGLAGLDAGATRRCLEAGVQSLARMRAYCARRVSADQLLAATLSAYMHGSSCEVSDEGRRRTALALSVYAASGLKSRD